METGKDSRCRGKIERIRVPLYFREEEDGGKRAYTRRYVRGFAKQRTKSEKGEKENEERMSGWFIKSLSPARWICAEEGAGGGAFI